MNVHVTSLVLVSGGHYGLLRPKECRDAEHIHAMIVSDDISDYDRIDDGT
jgi:hypothetical protein